ncbi:MAG: glycerol-3-phosphate cytidylyltransferase [Flavobacteriales bacterium]|nr:glycerol-3-phosphate cytidylyltransferase [Flavobacteriales bacterium]
MKENKTLITYGTFDLFHIGHVRLLKRIKERGDKLIVAVSTDEFNKSKGKKTIIPFNQRKEIVESIKYVDLVIPENDWNQKRDDIKTYNIDEFVMGSDWEGKFDELNDLCRVSYLPRTNDISSSALKNSLREISKISTTKLKDAIDSLNQILLDLD